MLTLQKSFNVGRYLLPLRRKFLARGKFFRRRNAIAARALGNVHARVGHANNVFNRKPVRGKAGHAEAAGDVMLAEHGVGVNPLAQALGQNFGLLRRRFPASE